MRSNYRHRVSGGPRASRSNAKSDQRELQAKSDMLERMVNRFAERIRVLEALHTLRVEEAGLIVGTVCLLYKKWREENPDEPDKGSAFMHWTERLTAEDVQAYAMGRWDNYEPVSSGGADSPEEN